MPWCRWGANSCELLGVRRSEDKAGQKEGEGVIPMNWIREIGRRLWTLVHGDQLESDLHKSHALATGGCPGQSGDPGLRTRKAPSQLTQESPSKYCKL
jgi:hypothetical protein